MQPQRPDKSQSSLGTWFAPFRRNIIGIDRFIDTPCGPKPLVYADWTAAGRAYAPIEQHLQQHILPLFANTHTAATHTGAAMTAAYDEAKATIKKHVNATDDDILLFCGSGMTAAVNKLQRLLGMRFPQRLEKYAGRIEIPEARRPLVLLTHMEHHSNHTSWLETIATVEIIRPNAQGLPDLDHLAQLLHQYRRRKTKIAAITACSNVTGIETPYHTIAALMHAHGGYCFVDFAASAPYTHIDMHPAHPTQADAHPTQADVHPTQAVAHPTQAGVRPTQAVVQPTQADAHPTQAVVQPTQAVVQPTQADAHLDAIYFSGHKFLGGPGTPGILVFNKKLYANDVPDQPGGGTILYSNPWKEHDYLQDIETREDGGTPPILQAIKAAQCIRLKDEMGIDNILQRENQLLGKAWFALGSMPALTVLARYNHHRLGIISFLVHDIHHDVVVQQLNDHFGIQTRGGCSCAGPYGHYLLNIGKTHSYFIRQNLRAGDLHSKPGWVRLSLHPTMTDTELDYILDAIETVATSATR